MKSLSTSLIAVCLLVGCMLLGPLASAMAQDAGAAELNLLNMILNGYIGFSIGLIVAVMGVYTLAMGDTKTGAKLIILGVLITLTPGVFNSARSLFCPMTSALTGASCH